jgi:fructose PTS system EIIBC or EIIC component
MSKLIAVTACPTGIAHTYMAAEKLETAAKAKGIEIKVETNGSGGAQNVLTQKDIDEAVAVIIAADTKVDMARFAGKHVIQTSVSEGIHKADQLIERALKQDAPIYQTKGEQSSRSGSAKGIYKHLMSGVSHMLPFVVAGGILIAFAFLADSLAYAFNILEGNVGDAGGNYGSMTSLSRFLMGIGGGAFSFMLPILAGYIAYSIADRPGLAVGFVGGYLAANPLNIFNADSVSGSGFLGALLAGFIAGYIVLGLRALFSGLPKSLEGIKPVLLYPLFGVFLIGAAMLLVNLVMGPINTGLNDFLKNIEGTHALLLGLLVGGMMAVDMGGPINKAAYAFGVGSLAAGATSIMAAVMIGGMIPPLGIALATTLFPGKFTKDQREAGKTNYVMGLSFITEGAIPFAAANPKAVLPAIISGSALAGALSMVFKVTSPAPHGGLFIIPVMSGWYLYIIALAAGTALTAFLLKVLLPDAE